MPDLFIDDDDAAVLKLLAIPSAAASRLPHRPDSVIYQRREREGQARTRARQGIAVDRIYAPETAAGKGRAAPTRSSLLCVDDAALTAVGERDDSGFMLAARAGFMGQYQPEPACGFS